MCCTSTPVTAFTLVRCITPAHTHTHTHTHIHTDLLRKHPRYSLHIVGHSLGGGIGSLLAHLAHNDARVHSLLMPPASQGVLKIKRMNYLMWLISLTTMRTCTAC